MKVYTFSITAAIRDKQRVYEGPPYKESDRRASAVGLGVLELVFLGLIFLVIFVLDALTLVKGSYTDYRRRRRFGKFR